MRGNRPLPDHLQSLAELTVEIMHKPYGFNDLARSVRRAIKPVPR